jgi:hypothetical protein
MRGAVSPVPQYAFMAWCLVRHRDNFTFTFMFQRQCIEVSLNVTALLVLINTALSYSQIAAVELLYETHFVLFLN